MSTMEKILTDLRQLVALKGGGEVRIDADLLAVVLDTRAELLAAGRQLLEQEYAACSTRLLEAVARAEGK